MEATVVSVGKAVLDGVVGYAKSAAAEEMALQLGVERDVGFVTDELEMMQSFLLAADEERDQNNKVLNTWVKQVRNVAYNVEDSLVDFEVHADREKPPLLGCIPRNPCDRRRIAMEVKELKAKVEEVSSRNLRYRLIKDGTRGMTLGAVGVEHGDIVGANVFFGIDEAWRNAMEQEKPKVDLSNLITSGEIDLRVIAVWGTSGDHGKTSEIRKAYDNPKTKVKFGCRAWVRLMHPFNPTEFLQCLVRQFYVNCSQDRENSKTQEGTTVGGNILLRMEKMEQSDLVHTYGRQVSNNSYLIVIDGLSSIDEWDCIKTYFPDKKKGSRIVVATQQAEIASLCPEQPYQVSKLEQMSSNPVLYLFHKKVEKLEAGSAPISKPASVTTANPSSSAGSVSEIQEEEVQQSNGTGSVQNVSTISMSERKFYRKKTFIPEDVVVGRPTDKQKVINLVGHPNDGHVVKVISVWGMGGIGKTTLVRSVYRSPELSCWRRAWATVLRPFNRDTLLRNLALQLQEDPDGTGEKKNIAALGSEELATELSKLIERYSCLIVLDDLTSIEEWYSIKHMLRKSRRIIATTREKFVAKHCSEDEKNIYGLESLEEDVALDLFKKKVFKDASSFDLHQGMLDLAKLILKKCDGLPLAISSIGGYLANKPKNALEWRKVNESLSAELETNPELKMINTALMRSYDGLPYHLKVCFLYLSIFPEDHKIRRNHVVKRWIAEGFSREMRHMTAVQVGNKYFDELLDRSMTLPLERADGEVDSCQLHDLIREICVAKAREDNLVFTLEEGCSLGGTHGAIRHLVISSNWKRDKDMIQRMLDLSHMRSLTVFGQWRSFFISSKMRFLRVLDLKHTVGLKDRHLYQIMELLHLRYLSLRGCADIMQLPDSLANLRQLQTLDVTNIRILRLPMTVTSLQKLQCLRARGIVIPTGISKLKAMQTLRGVLLLQEEDISKELKKLTQLRKLGVAGVTKENHKRFWQAIAGYSRLQSLSLSVHISSSNEIDSMDSCLGKTLWPPKCLESLKIYGRLIKLTEWIHQLQNLSKLQLVETWLNQDAINAISMLPNLLVLRLIRNSYNGNSLRVQRSSFPSLLVLKLWLINYFPSHTETVEFEQDAMPKLERLQIYQYFPMTEISGLHFLRSLKEIRVGDNLKELVQRKLTEYPNNVTLKLT